MLFRRLLLCAIPLILTAGLCACESVCDRTAIDRTNGFLSAVNSLDLSGASSFLENQAATRIASDAAYSDTPDSAYPAYKSEPVRIILENTVFTFDEEASYTEGNDEGDAGLICYQFSMPDYNSVLAENPGDTEEFRSMIESAGRLTGSIEFAVIMSGGEWQISNAKAMFDILDSLFAPVYSFAITGDYYFADISDNEGVQLTDVSEISISLTVDDAYISAGENKEIRYELYYQDEYVAEGEPELVFADDNDTNSTILPVAYIIRLDAAALSVPEGFAYFPMGEYELRLLDRDKVFHSHYFDVTVSEDLVPDESVCSNVFWQGIDACGMCFNTDTLSATMVISQRYLSSGRDMDITFDICRTSHNSDSVSESAGDEEIIVSEGSCEYTSSCAHANYIGDSMLPAGEYTVIFYNYGSRVGSSTVTVVNNLNPDRYAQAEIPEESSLADAEDAELLIYSYSESEIDIIEDYTDYDFDYEVPSLNTFTHTVDAVLASGENAPDIIICDSIYAAAYANHPGIVPVNTVGISNDELRFMFEYTFNMTLNSNNQVTGLAWQITPGGLFYNRNIAQRYLGVSEPDDVSTYFDSWDSYLQTARSLREASNGRVRINANSSDIQSPYFNGRSQPWYQDGEVLTDSYILDFFSLMNSLVNEELTYNSSRWSSEWQGRITNGTVLSFWGTLDFGQMFLKNSHVTWGLVRGPVDYFDGGAFLFVTRYCDMPLTVGSILRDITCDESNMALMAEDGHTVNNINVMLDCAEDEAYNVRWLGGQNPYEVLTSVSRSLTGTFITSEDAEINELFLDSVRYYITDGGNLDSYLDDFVSAVEELEAV